MRLNPNIPWKTRGNAALAARFGRGFGAQRRLGEIDGRPVRSHARGRALAPADAERWLERAWARLLRASRLGDAGTDPALVAVDRRLPERLYWRAVREVVEVRTVADELRAAHATVRTSGSERGLVGAAAAIAWPGRRRTWELIAYRPEARWGTPREVDAASVRRASERLPALFLCRDPRTRRLLVTPHTPCPILFGLRATDPKSAAAARRLVRSEAVERWLLFRTNQGTGDHLRPTLAADLAEYTSGIVGGEVVGPPSDLAGGHVRLAVRDDDGGVVDCYAFEPTKTLPRVARSLRPGDRVRVWGSRGPDPAFHLEGIEIVELAERWGEAASPRCARCGRRARSLGHQRGYRCPGCHRRWPPEAARRTRARPAFGPGVYHPTPSARRHLAPRPALTGEPAASESF